MMNFFRSLFVLALVSATGSASAITLFSEDFEGYTSFPDEAPNNDEINAGIPKISEGASEIWYGARFEDPDSGSGSSASINSDLAVQNYGDAFSAPCYGDNCTHTGRVEDDAGLLFKVDATNMTGLTLSFDWRTYSANSGDKVVVGYRIGSIGGFGTCTGNGEAGCFADLRNSMPWYTTQTGTSLTGNWTQLMRANADSDWNSETFSLTGADDASEVWVAIWLDNGEGDFAKFDNVVVTATPVPEAETYAMMLAGLGLVGFMVSRRRSTAAL
jgi:hypothetical protein